MKLLTASPIMLCAVLASFLTANATGFEVIAPHRAIYEISLKDASKRSGIRNMKGRMVYEVRGNECEGISLQYRFLTNITTAKDQFVSDQRTSTFESADGKSFNFLTKTFLNEQLEETVKGIAKQVSDGGLNVVLDSPAEAEFDFAGASFLTSYLVDMINVAKSGEHYLRGDLFDGSDGGDETISTSSFISGLKSIKDSKHTHSQNIVEDLKSLKAWSVAMSYFKKNIGATAEHLPIFESSFLLFENGISSDLVMRYPDYTLTGKLTKLELFDNPPCRDND